MLSDHGHRIADCGLGVDGLKKKQWRWVFAGFCLVAAIALLLIVHGVLGPFVLAFILSYLLNPLVEWLEQHRLGRSWAIAVVFTGIILVIGIGILLILPTLYNELSTLATVLPQTVNTVEQFLHGLSEQFKAAGLPSKVIAVLDQHFGQGEEVLAGRLQVFLNNLPEALTSIGLFVLSPVLAIYFLADWPRLSDGLHRMVQSRWRMEWQRLWQDINHVLRRFLRGHMLVAAIVGVMTGIGVKLIGMDYALLIGLICGISDVIPFFGPLIGGVPSVLLALTKSPFMALKVLLVILVVQQLENDVISPKLMGDSIGLHPLWVVFAILAGGEIGGVWGMILAVPAAAVLRVVLRFVYLRLVAPEL